MGAILTDPEDHYPTGRRAMPKWIYGQELEQASLSAPSCSPVPFSPDWMEEKQRRHEAEDEANGVEAKNTGEDEDDGTADTAATMQVVRVATKTQFEPCPQCKGSGEQPVDTGGSYLSWARCTRCRGVGQVPIKESL